MFEASLAVNNFNSVKAQHLCSTVTFNLKMQDYIYTWLIQYDWSHVS